MSLLERSRGTQGEKTAKREVSQRNTTPHVIHPEAEDSILRNGRGLDSHWVPEATIFRRNNISFRLKKQKTTTKKPARVILN